MRVYPFAETEDGGVCVIFTPAEAQLVEKILRRATRDGDDRTIRCRTSKRLANLIAECATRKTVRSSIPKGA